MLIVLILCIVVLSSCLIRFRLNGLEGLQAKKLNGLCLGSCIDLAIGAKLALWTRSGYGSSMTPVRW